jgi:hypothetical protein
MGAIGIEPMTPAMSTRYSNQLSYAPGRLKVYQFRPICEARDVFNLQMVFANHGVPRSRRWTGDAVIRGFRHSQVEHSLKPKAHRLHITVQGW